MTKTLVIPVDDLLLLNRYGALSGHYAPYSADYDNQIVHDVTEDDAVAADRLVATAVREMRLDLDAFVELSHSSRIALHAAVVWLEQLPSVVDHWRVAPKEAA